jgi:hypothetical protein
MPSKFSWLTSSSASRLCASGRTSALRETKTAVINSRLATSSSTTNNFISDTQCASSQQESYQR